MRKFSSTQPIIPFIRETQIKSILTPKIANTLVQKAFAAMAQGFTQMPSKIYIQLPKGDYRAMPAAFLKPKALVGIKWVSVYPLNRKQGKPSVIGTMLLNDPQTGELLTVIEANTITAFRTGAAGAIASRHLARKNSTNLLLVGAGTQSYYQWKCHQEFFNFNQIRIWSPALDEAKRLCSRLVREGANPQKVDLHPVNDLKRASLEADIICTCTPSERPLLLRSWIKEGTHINAIGADAKGKQELDVAILKSARVFVDDWEQASHSGELNKAVSRSLLHKKDIAGSLGQVITRQIKGRLNDSQITVFDSTGLAIQDLALANYLWEHAS